MSAVLELRDLTRTYGRKVGIEGLDLDVLAGEVFGFLGPNGAGKTTTIRLVLDLIRPTRGTVHVLGGTPSDAFIRGRMGYIPGELALDGRMSGGATLRFLAGLNRPRPLERRRGELCERLGLPPAELRRRVREYSRGMKQKLALVSAFEHDPELLVLDEPTSGLDPLVREVVFELMAEAAARGATVFHSSHVLSEVDRTCHRVAVLREGRLAALMDVADVRRTAVRRMVIDFAYAVPVDALRLPGVELVEAQERRAVVRVSGNPGPLLRVLAQHPVDNFVFPEPSLEEAFAAFYAAEEVAR